MHYPWCDGNMDTAFALTAADGWGARQLYGPLPGWLQPLINLL